MRTLPSLQHREVKQEPEETWPLGEENRRNKLLNLKKWARVVIWQHGCGLGTGSTLAPLEVEVARAGKYNAYGFIQGLL